MNIMVHHLHGDGFSPVAGSVDVRVFEKLVDKYPDATWTFDDRLVSQELAVGVLDRKGIRGKFFVVGKNVMEQDRLTREGLDNGEPLFYAYGTWRFTDYFTYSMSAVKNAIDKLGWYLQTGDVGVDAPEDKYTAYKKKTDFTLEMARKICKL